MYEKEKDLIDAFLRGQMSRRSLVRGLGAMGVTAGTAGFLVNAAQTRALAADFDWKKHSGKTVKLLLNKHPYTDAMIANLETFKALTGMEVEYDVFPEDVYFDKVTAALSSRSSEYDAFMTGAYMTWTYGPAGWIVDHNEWIQDSSKTNPGYNWGDMLEGVRQSCAWNGRPGGALGSDDAFQWCIPWGYEQNNLAYNAAMLETAGVDVPTNMDELMEAAARLQAANDGVYGIGVRGSRSWATIHPGFLSGYANYGEKDLNVSADGKLSAAMNTAVSKEYHAKWVKMIQDSGAADWSTHTWYQVGTELGAGKSAMIYDADILGYFMNGGDNAMAGKLAYAPFAANPAASAPTPNIWIWSLSMSKFSKDLDATWYFMQWASGPEHGLFGASEMDFVNPVRQSVWDDAGFRKRLSDSYPGYVEMHDVSAPGAKIHFTAQPLFIDAAHSVVRSKN
ncbi:MAG: extracellular solute-binding protein, partial [Pseudomonadota bacterium]